MPVLTTNAVTNGVESTVLLSQSLGENETAFLNMVVLALDESNNTAQFDRTARIRRPAGGGPPVMFDTPKNLRARSGDSIGWECDIVLTPDGYQVIVTGTANKVIKWGSEVTINVKSWLDY